VLQQRFNQCFFLDIPQILNGGSGFPAANRPLYRNFDRGWKAAPTTLISVYKYDQALMQSQWSHMLLEKLYNKKGHSAARMPFLSFV